MPESEGGGREFIHDGRVALIVVAVVEPVGLKSQVVQVDRVPAQHARKEFVPSEMLKINIVFS